MPWTLPPPSHSLILIVTFIYESLYINLVIDCYWVGPVPTLDPLFHCCMQTSIRVSSPKEEYHWLLDGEQSGAHCLMTWGLLARGGVRLGQIAWGSEMEDCQNFVLYVFSIVNCLVRPSIKSAPKKGPLFIWCLQNG